MKKSFTRKTVSVLLSILLVFLMSLSVSAKDLKEKYTKDTSEIIGIAYKGDIQNFPENSLEAIVSCIDMGLDGVAVQVRRTSDGTLVLMEDENTARTCVDASGMSVTYKVSETSFDVLKDLRLLKGQGGKSATPTVYKMPKLEDALRVAEGKIMLFIYCDESLLDTVYDAVRTFGALDYVVFRSNMKSKTFADWASSKEIVPGIMTYHRSNVIFRAVSQFNLAKNQDINCVQYATSNQYGVIFSNFFMKRFGDIRACISLAEQEACGKRPDTVVGWEDLISRGYSVLETANAQELSSYLQALRESKLVLEQTYKESLAVDLSLYSASTSEDVQQAQSLAKQILEGHMPASESRISQTHTALKTALNSLAENDGKPPAGKFVVTPMRIFWAVFAIALFVLSQYYIYRKTKKS